MGEQQGGNLYKMRNINGNLIFKKRKHLDYPQAFWNNYLWKVDPNIPNTDPNDTAFTVKTL